MHENITPMRRWLIMANAAVSTFMATLDGSIVNIALPKMASALKVEISSIQWVVTSYLLTIVLTLLLWGKLADIQGKKKIFGAGFFLFTLGSLLCGLSGTLPMLVFARVLQAIGASAMMALSQGIVTAIFPPESRGKALGIVGTTVAVGSLVGPSLGGVLVHAFGWESIFFVNIPVGIVGILMTILIMPPLHDAPQSKRFDFRGAGVFVVLMLMFFVSLLMFQDGKISGVVLATALLCSGFLLWRFIRMEKTMESPLIELSIFRNMQFSSGLISGFMAYLAINGLMLFMPFYLQLVLGFEPMKAGLLMSFYPLMTGTLAPVAGSLSDKLGYRPLTLTGLCVTLLTQALMILTLSPDSQFVQVAVLMAMAGIGSAIFMSPNNSSVMGGVPRNQLGIAGGVSALSRNVGFTMGSTLSVMIFSLVTHVRMDDMGQGVNKEIFMQGFRAVLIMTAVAAVSALVVSLMREKPEKQMAGR